MVLPTPLKFSVSTSYGLRQTFCLQIMWSEDARSQKLLFCGAMGLPWSLWGPVLWGSGSGLVYMGSCWAMSLWVWCGLCGVLLCCGSVVLVWSVGSSWAVSLWLCYGLYGVLLCYGTGMVYTGLCERRQMLLLDSTSAVLIRRLFIRCSFKGCLWLCALQTPGSMPAAEKLHCFRVEERSEWT